MALIKAINYDPAVAVTKSMSALLPMTALDTTNLRITFTAPDSGNVLVRLRGVLEGGSLNRLFLGVLEAGVTRIRAVPTGIGSWYASTTTFNGIEATFVQTGLTPGASYTWDAAYGVESTSSNTLRYGGPDDAIASNANGPFVFEIWEA